MVGFRSRVGTQRITSGTRASQAEFTRSLRENMRQIEKNLKLFIDSVERMTPEILYEALRPTFDKSQRYCPKDTGDLRRSGYLEVKQTARGGMVEIGYGRGGQPFYAVYVHERTDISHKSPTRAKFLQSALEEDEPEIQKRIVQGYKRRTRR